MIEEEDVKAVAENARIQISEEELKKFIGDFEEILEMFDQISDIDTENVEPAFQPVEVSPTKREDKEEETLTSEEVFKNTDNEKKGFFKGPSI